jgi:hypothetical protein
MDTEMRVFDDWIKFLFNFTTMIRFSPFEQQTYTLERFNEQVIHKLGGTLRAVWVKGGRSDRWLKEAEGGSVWRENKLSGMLYTEL